MLSSQAGDFAEWHEKEDGAEQLPEGTVVGFHEGKVSKRTAQANILGVVSARALLLGSARLDQAANNASGACVAYCGLVPGVPLWAPLFLPNQHEIHLLC